MSGSTTSPAGTPSPTDPRLAAAIDRWVDAASSDTAAALAAVVARVAEARDCDVAFVVDETPVVPDGRVAAVDVDETLLRTAGPWLPGFVREALLSPGGRRRGGVHHTSPAMADALVDLVVGVRPFAASTVVADPAVGGGVFLLAACARMPGNRADRVGRVVGCDTDPLAVAVTVAALTLWSGGVPPAPDAIRVADGLGAEPFGRRPDVVVGNPPFLSQLRDGTARDGARRAALRARWPDVGGYVDDAALFLPAAVDRVAEHGVVALVQPSSFLSARDAAPVRKLLLAAAPPVALWIDGDRQFDAAVDTVALVVEKGAVPGPVRRVTGVPAVALADADRPAAASWAALLLDDSTPRVRVGEAATAGTVGDVARVTAGFRAQFYGLRGAVYEDPDGRHPLITSGLVDPLHCRWGETTCRFDGRAWRHPCVDPDAVAPEIHDWVAARLRPKLLIASQTKAVEVVLDPTGVMVPCTPVISVEPGAGAPSLAHLAAAVSSPLATALLVAEAAGSALSRHAVRVSATAIAALPLPQPGPAWDAAAAAVTHAGPGVGEAALIEFGRAALAAYGMQERTDIAKWWRTLLPCR